ncbi:ABC transporter permease [Tessaracoccus antarcticus]|uniref:ABC transporter permease n=1 Tax=Tessaracoccus antarcticus TaxID=2479848 RepID=A0A3M0GKT0_9ACTN|nr:ABC transporter permease [Tessaracoccus antarcticus]RMB62223.1 ABC transporter permease [Tessaracoccus antarcticus]
MRWSDLIGASLSSLRQRFFRTLLTVLGVVIGTTSVIVMVSIGVGLSSSMTGSMETNLSLRQVTVTAPPPKEASTGASLPTAMDEKMLTALETLPGVEVVWPVYRVQMEIRVGAYTTWLEVEGVPLDAIEALNVPFESGAMPEKGAPLSLVLGNMVSQNFYDPMTGEPADIDLMSQPMFVTFPENDPYDQVPMPGNGDGGEEEPTAPPKPPKKFIVPAAGILSGQGQEWGPYSYMVAADQTSLVDALEKAFPGKALPSQPATAAGKPKRGFIYSEFRLLAADTQAAELLYTGLQEQGYEAHSDIEWIREAQNTAVLVQAVLGGIGFVSLFVAAIGIANTMMMSVYERTKEIGVMKVLGAALSDIRKLFLIESAAIGFFGGLLGLLLSLAISALINAVVAASSGAEMGGGLDSTISVIPVWLMLGAVVFATSIGTLAGLLPAHRAMRLSPLEAIRAQ